MRLVREPKNGVADDAKNGVAPAAVAAAIGHVLVDAEVVPGGLKGRDIVSHGIGEPPARFGFGQ